MNKSIQFFVYRIAFDYKINCIFFTLQMFIALVGFTGLVQALVGSNTRITGSRMVSIPQIEGDYCVPSSELFTVKSSVLYDYTILETNSIKLAITQCNVVLGTVVDVNQTGSINTDGTHRVQLAYPFTTTPLIPIEHRVHLWANRKVYYTFESLLPETSRTIISQGARDWFHQTGIEFIATSIEDVVEKVVIYPSKGCWSFIGKQLGNQQMGFGPSCGLGAARHLFGLVLGLYHEHLRSDRDVYLNLMYENIPIPFHSMLKQTYETLLGPFDAHSIMMFHSDSFSVNQTASFLLHDGTWITRNDDISIQDALKVMKLYPMYTTKSWNKLGDWSKQLKAKMLDYPSLFTIGVDDSLWKCTMFPNNTTAWTELASQVHSIVSVDENSIVYISTDFKMYSIFPKNQTSTMIRDDCITGSISRAQNQEILVCMTQTAMEYSKNRIQWYPIVQNVSDINSFEMESLGSEIDLFTLQKIGIVSYARFENQGWNSPVELKGVRSISQIEPASFQSHKLLFIIHNTQLLFAIENEPGSRYNYWFSKELFTVQANYIYHDQGFLFRIWKNELFVSHLFETPGSIIKVGFTPWQSLGIGFKQVAAVKGYQGSFFVLALGLDGLVFQLVIQF
jgi:hypothetical protein